MQVVVTGGAGFIGSHVVDALVAEHHRVRVVDVLSDAAHVGPPPYLRDDVEYIEADVCDLGAGTGIVAGADAVAHLASRVGLGRDFGDAPDYVRDNALGTAVLLAALDATGFTGRVALASSMVVYGVATVPPTAPWSVRRHGRHRTSTPAGSNRSTRAPVTTYAPRPCRRTAPSTHAARTRPPRSARSICAAYSAPNAACR